MDIRSLQERVYMRYLVPLYSKIMAGAYPFVDSHWIALVSFALLWVLL